MNNNYGISLNHIPYDLKKIFRCLQRTCKKINNLVWSIMFNKTCLNEIFKIKNNSKYWFKQKITCSLYFSGSKNCLCSFFFIIFYE